MPKSKIAALVGSILYTIISVLGLIAIILLRFILPADELQRSLNMEQLTSQELNMGLSIAYTIIFILMVFNWVGFAKLSKNKKWSVYFLVLGLFYLVASMVNGAGLIITLPISISFILAFVFRRQE